MFRRFRAICWFKNSLYLPSVPSKPVVFRTKIKGYKSIGELSSITANVLYKKTVDVQDSGVSYAEHHYKEDVFAPL